MAANGTLAAPLIAVSKREVKAFPYSRGPEAMPK
jgi:hypothetical protein